MKFKQLKAGPNVTITDDGAGTLTVNSTATSGFTTARDVSTSRATNTNYTAIAPTLVCVTATVVATGVVTAKVGGVTMGTIQVPSGGGTITVPISFMVPNGSTYSITFNNNSLATLVSWTETS
jgi:2-keto-3-deoxy-galactonokinase